VNNCKFCLISIVDYIIFFLLNTDEKIIIYNYAEEIAYNIKTEIKNMLLIFNN